MELFFEVKEDEKSDPSKDGIILQDLKIIGATWDSNKKCIIKSEYNIHCFH